MVKKFVISALIVLILDSLTKYLISLYEPSIKLFPFFALTYVQNTGAGFGILKGQNILLIIISLIVVGLIWYYFKKIPESQYIAYGIITGGILGNLSDRIFRGFVVDFLDFFIGSYHWPAFNIADTALVIGVLILIFKELKN